MRDLVEWVDRCFSTGDQEDGQGMLEYALIIVLVAMLVIFALMILGPKVANVFNYASNSLNY